MMHAVILAAGIGTRLGSANQAKPKCLLRFGGESLLRRHLDALAQSGVDYVHVVTGFGAARIADELAQLPDVDRVALIHNPHYDAGSIVSLGAAREVLRRGRSVLLMDADVLYPPHLLARLINNPAGSCCLLDRDFEDGDEPVKIFVRAGRIVEFRKKFNPQLQFDYNGESIGFFKFGGDMAAQLANIVDDYVQSGRIDQPHEEAVRDLMLRNGGTFGIEDVTGLPWIEIDFPEDVVRADREILPAIENQT